jgi:CheY-like chemotaxis protein
VRAGGEARIASTLSGGTTVTLLFHEADGPAPGAADEVPAAAAAAGHRAARVLLVDDDEAVRQVVRGGLELRGFKVLDVGSGEAALAMAGENPEIAVIDYAMPGMDGAQTAEQLRRMMPQLPIILASGHPDTASIERALGGHATVLRKPFDIEALCEAVTHLLAGAAADGRA